MRRTKESIRQRLRERVARVLKKEVEVYQTIVPNDMAALYRSIRKGDVVLVEGRQRISRMIKLFTQSQWSHMALYIGDELLHREPSRREELRARYGDQADKLVLEALVEEGVVVSPLQKYQEYNLRVCRPFNITGPDLERVLTSVLGDIGKQYDRRNILHLAFQLLPLNFGPFRRKSAEVCIGACSEFQVICSGFIAKAFQHAGFLIRPILVPVEGDAKGERVAVHLQHPSRIAPRDFDLSPNFEIVKFNRIPQAGSGPTVGSMAGSLVELDAADPVAG